jgi:hypothetical protein
MKALSIRQPWAWLIVNGFKDVENRTWPTKFRGRICVQAGQKVVSQDFPAQLAHLQSIGIDLPIDLPRGAIVGEVTILDCITMSYSPWYCGPYGFLLSDPIAYERPLPYRGRLGLFEVDDGYLKNNHS